MNYLRLAVIMTLLCSCVSPAPKESSFYTGEGEANGMAFNWEQCPVRDGHGCINGDLSGKPYSLGFAEEGRILTGLWGDQTIRLALDEPSVSALGSDVYEMVFFSSELALVASVTWNAAKNRVIGHDLVSSK